jgi:glycosyltransferase involved in cell wall biosynthesis
MTAVDVLIPTRGRPAALAVTLCGLVGQTHRQFRVIVSDQTEDSDVADVGEVQAVTRVLEYLGCSVQFYKHLPPRGLAEQRQFLLDQASSPRVLFLDDDIILEPDLLERLLAMLDRERCGFVGSAMIGLKYQHVVRPHEEAIEFWDGSVQPEVVMPDGPHWARHKLHNACNLLHVQQRLGLTSNNQRLYKVAWVAGCVLYDTACLRAVGGFSFWRDLPPVHCGEDVLAELRVMARFGGCGLAPSGAYHQDLPTTVVDRSCDAPRVLSVETSCRTAST